MNKGAEHLARVRHFEEAGFAALPAAFTEHDDGWVIRIKSNYPVKRLNSMTALDPPDLEDFDALLVRAEKLYSRHRRPLVVRQTPLAPAGFEAYMNARGWASFDQSLVMYLEPIDIEDGLDADIREVLNSREWVDAFFQISGESSREAEGFAEMIDAIEAHSKMLLLEVSACPVAAVRYVIADGLCGIFDMVTTSSHRRSGFGERILSNALQRATLAGASCAWLQVVADNAPAVNLYKKLGFRIAYDYRYWRKPE